MVESSTSSVTIRDRNNQQHVLSRAQISELKESAVSLMPDGLLEALTPQQVMDLFAYVQSDRK
jgi:putative heme-binding domain-containing protein